MKARSLQYRDRLLDGRYVLKVEPAESNTRIIFVGGTSITVPSDEEIELRSSHAAKKQPSLFAFPASELGGTRRENAAIVCLVLLVTALLGRALHWPW